MNVTKKIHTVQALYEEWISIKSKVDGSNDLTLTSKIYLTNTYFY